MIDDDDAAPGRRLTGVLGYMLALLGPLALLRGGWDEFSIVLVGSLAVGCPVGYRLAWRRLGSLVAPRAVPWLSAAAGGLSLLLFLPLLALLAGGLHRLTGVAFPRPLGYLAALAVAVVNGWMWTAAAIVLAPRFVRLDSRRRTASPF